MNEEYEGKTEVEDLREWLYDRINDDQDIVVDEIQEEFAKGQIEKDDAEGHVKGSEEYLKNLELLETTIAKIKATGTKVTSESKQKCTDGIRTCYYGGSVDNKSQPNGNGQIVYENKDQFTGEFEHGILNRKGKLVMPEQSLAMEGQWVDGLPEGEMKIDTHFGWVEGYFSKGVPHGYQREFGPKDFNGKRVLYFFGRFYKGVRRGFCWKGSLGGAWICGDIKDPNGEFTGDDFYFIYPDFKTVLRGKFKKGLLVEARLHTLTGCVIENGIGKPVTEKVSGHDAVYTYENPGLKWIADNPLLSDPWEENLVEVKESLEPQGGDGLFAKKDIPAKTMLCLFNGIRLKQCLLSVRQLPSSDYRIRLNADLDLDIPTDCIPVNKYCATLGHKANHSNVPNANWALIEHPRFGMIRALASSVDIKAGDEILINYHMNLADAPMWYKMVWLRHQREYKKLSELSIVRILNRYTEDTGKRVDIDLEEGANFYVPDPKGVCHMDELADIEEITDEHDFQSNENKIDQEQLDKVKNMLRIK